MQDRGYFEDMSKILSLRKLPAKTLDKLAIYRYY